MPQLQTKTFTAPRTPAEAPLLTQMNQFFADNPTITIMDVSIGWREGASRGRLLSLAMTFITGELVKEQFPAGAPYHMVEFISTRTSTAEAQAQAFFAANPQALSIRTFVVQSQESRYTNFLRLMVLYLDTDYMTLLHAPLEASGFPTADITAGANGTTADATDDTRSRMAPTRNLSTQPWVREGAALVAKARDADGRAAYAAIGPNLFTPGAPTTLPPPPVVPGELPKCDCCYKLVSFDIAYGEAACLHTWNLTPDFDTCYKGDTNADIMKALVNGYIEVGGFNGLPGACICNPANVRWMWPDPQHYYFTPQTPYENGFWAVVGFEDLAPACSDNDFNDSIIVMCLERCASLATSGGACKTAPPNPATPGVPGT